MDVLSPIAQHYVDSLGSHNTTVSGIRDPKDISVYDAIQEGVKRANLHATSNAQRVSPHCVVAVSSLINCCIFLFFVFLL